MAEVRLARRAQQDLDALGDKVAQRVLGALERLRADPRDPSLDVKVLSGRRPWRRMRVGEHRELFRLADRGRTVLVARIVDRRDLQRAVRALS